MGLHGGNRFRCETTEMDITHQMKQLARPRVYMITLNIARLRPVSANTTHHDQVFHLAEQIIDSYKLRAPIATMDFLKQLPLVHDLAFDGDGSVERAPSFTPNRIRGSALRCFPRCQRKMV